MARSRKRNGLPLPVALLILAAMAAIGAAWWLAVHLAVLAGFVVILGAVFYVGRRYERRRVAPATRGTLSRPGAAPDPADQIRHLEQLAARPISAIIASYEGIQRRYGGQL